MDGDALVGEEELRGGAAGGAPDLRPLAWRVRRRGRLPRPERRWVPKLAFESEKAVLFGGL